MSDPETEHLYVQFLNSTSGQWIPAKQNSYTVCSELYIQMQFGDNKVKVKLYNGPGVTDVRPLPKYRRRS
jgi:hypothetical protein